MAYTKSQKKTAVTEYNKLFGNIPTYTSQYQGDIDSLVNQIKNRGAFSYDASSDPLYKQMSERYMDMGKTAMQDTMANSAALTGGYGNSYASTAGNLAYQDYLKGIADNALSYQQNALNVYNNEGDTLNNKLTALRNAENDAYQRYQNDLSNYYNQLNYWAGIANSGGSGRGGSGGNNGAYVYANDELTKALAANNNITKSDIQKASQTILDSGIVNTKDDAIAAASYIASWAKRDNNNAYTNAVKKYTSKK